MKKNFATLVIFSVLIIAVFALHAQAAPLREEPQEFTQPNGTVVNCFLSGDEYFHYLHDEQGNILIVNQDTGYLVYAKVDGEEVVPSSDVFGKTSPENAPNLKREDIPASFVNEKVEFAKEVFDVNNDEENQTSALKGLESMMDQQSNKGLLARFAAPVKNQGTMNKIVLFIAFNDSPVVKPFQLTTISRFTQILDTASTSLKNYFKEVSYNKLTIEPRFPGQGTGNDEIKPYVDNKDMGYYMPATDTNTIGYDRAQADQMIARRQELITKALDYYKPYIEALNLDLDYDKNGWIDNISFVIAGRLNSVLNSADILWPHNNTFRYPTSISSNGSQLYGGDYCFTYENQGASANCEMQFYMLGSNRIYAPDTAKRPVGTWDLMDGGSAHMTMYMKYKYGNWISNIPKITTSGPYTLGSAKASENNVYRIDSPYSSDEFYILEYRRKADSAIENYVPADGLLVYKVNTKYNGNSNATGISDMGMFVFRPDVNSVSGYSSLPGAITSAALSSSNYANIGKGNYTGTHGGAKLFLSNDAYPGFEITEVGAAGGNEISFKVTFDTLPNMNMSFSQQPGVYYQDSLNLEISAASGSTIYYTTDGSDPTVIDNGVLKKSDTALEYTGTPITLIKPSTIKAKAFIGTLANPTLAGSIEGDFYVSKFPESMHNYALNTDYTWDYTLEGASRIAVTFDDLTELGRFTPAPYSYDKIYIYDKNGNIVPNKLEGAVSTEYYTFRDLNSQTLEVDGDTVSIRLVCVSKTDTRRLIYGFKVTNIEEIYNVDLSFNPAPKAYYEASKTVYITGAPQGAEVRYTVDGSEPTATSTLYTSAGIVITEPTVIKAKAFGSAGMKTSTMTGTYYVQQYPGTFHNYAENTFATWEYTLPGAENLKVTFSDKEWLTYFAATPFNGDKLYIYDKNDNPIENKAYLPASTEFFAAQELRNKTIEVPGDTIKLKLVCVSTSDARKLNYGFQIVNIESALANPTANVPSGTVVRGTQVTLNSTNAAANIYYTTDGSEPNENSTLFDGLPITITSNTTIKAIAMIPGFGRSDVVTFTYTVPQGDSPVVVVGSAMGKPGDIVDIPVYIDGNPGVWSYNYALTYVSYNSAKLEPISVAQGEVVDDNFIYSINKNASTIKCSWNEGQNAEYNGTLYSIKFKILEGLDEEEVALNLAVEMVRKPEGSTQGEEVTTEIINGKVKVVVPTAPVATPPSGFVTKGTQIVLSATANDPNQVIYYTTDGSEPTKSSKVYTGPITITEDMTIKAVTVKYGTVYSEVKTFEYVTDYVKFTIDGAPATAIIPDTKLTVSAAQGIVDGSQTMIVVLYDKDGVFVDMKDNLGVADSQRVMFNGSIDIPEDIEAGAYIKVYFWDSLEGMIPVREPVDFPAN